MPKGDYLTTITGRKFWPLDPSVNDIDINDIAWALSRICRYGGHTCIHYSVATHCIAVSYLVPEEYALWALLHDASEAYVGDMVRPLKHMMPEYMAVEEKVVSTIAEAFGLESPMPECVHTADRMITEAEKYMFTNQVILDTPEEMQPYIAALEKATHGGERSVDVYLRYLARFTELTS